LSTCLWVSRGRAGLTSTSLHGSALHSGSSTRYVPALALAQLAAHLGAVDVKARPVPEDGRELDPQEEVATLPDAIGAMRHPLLWVPRHWSRRG